MTERDLTTKCMTKLRAKTDGKWWKIHGGPNQPRGIPDILGCLFGYFVGIEMKMPGKERTLTPKQRKALQDIYDAEGFAFVCTSVQEVMEVVRHVGDFDSGTKTKRKGGW